MRSDDIPAFVGRESRGWFVVLETGNRDAHIASDHTVEVKS